MTSVTTSAPFPRPLGPVAWVGRSVVNGLAYSGGVTVLLLRVVGWLIWPWRSARPDHGPGFFRSLFHQLFWMVFMGIPLVALVHVAIGSFLSLQAYYGSTFVDGTGAVVGVGLLRNLGGIMSGMTFSGILAARMIPELRAMRQHQSLEGTEPAYRSSESRPRRGTTSDPSAGETISASLSVVAPRVVAASIACILLTMWGITVGTVVGWKASESLMGLSTEMFFMMMLKMMWFRDVLGLLVKGILFGAIPAAICCFEGLSDRLSEHTGDRGHDDLAPHPTEGLAPPASVPVFRAVFLSMVAILIMNSSWFMLVYHAVPFYGPTLLPQP
jgi:phospholipid/cholesterol/gamma-HCH transport system permease protein